MVPAKKCVLHINFTVASHFITNQLIGFDEFEKVLITRKKLSCQSGGKSGSIFRSIHYWDARTKTGMRMRALSQRLFGRQFSLENLIQKTAPNLIHVHYGTAAADLVYLRNRFNIPLITSFYGGDLSAPSRDKAMKSRYSRLFGIGDLFLVEGSFARRTLIDLGCPEEKIRIHHLGIDPGKFQFVRRRINKNEPIQILMCSRFEEKKGYPIALRSFKELIEANYRAELTIIGDGELKNEIAGLIDELEIGPYVRLLGRRSYEEYQNISRNSHFFLMPSMTSHDGRTEGGAPTVLIEMQASGMPIVASRHADIPEVVLDTKTGYLSKEADVSDLTGKLILMIESQGEWGQMGLEGRRHIEQNYNSRIASEGLRSMYNQLLINRQ